MHLLAYMTHTLITGGAGFIGSHIVHALVGRGERVRVLDNFSTGKSENLETVTTKIDLVKGDLRDLKTCIDACANVHTVYHLAALGSVPRSVSDPLTTHDVNVTGTLNLLMAAMECKVRRLVFSSSSSVYGDTPTLPKQESMPLSPLSPYAVSKLAGEEYCRVFAKCYGLEAVVLRYFNVFGPRQDPNSQYAAVIPRFLMALSEGRQPVIYGDGLQSRDFTYVSNVVEANLLAGTVTGIAGDVFNIACDSQITVSEVLTEAARLVSKRYEALYLPARSGDIVHSRADITHARDLLGFRPNIDFSEGMARTVQYYIGGIIQ